MLVLCLQLTVAEADVASLHLYLELLDAFCQNIQTEVEGAGLPETT